MPLVDLPHFLILGIAGIFGAMIGSFFNVVVYRMPREESVVFPASRCPICGKSIRAWENIPVLSWLWLRGKCAQCKTAISVEYPIVESITGAWAALLTYDVLQHPQPLGTTMVFFYFALCAIPIIVIDFRHYLIPDVLVLPGIVIALGAAFLPGGIKPWESLVGGLGAGLFLWSIGALATKLLKKDAMGFGDVKLLALSGACFGWETAFLGLAIGSVLGSLGGIPMLFLRKLDAERHIPFGPFLCAGVLIAFKYGQPMLDWYLNHGGE